MSTSCLRLHPHPSKKSKWSTNHMKHYCCIFFLCAQAKQKLCIIVGSPKDSDWPVYISWECASKKKREANQTSVSGSERVLPSFRSDGSSINALLSDWSGKRSHFSTRNSEKEKKKTQTWTVAFVSCRKSYTHRSPFSNYFFYYKASPLQYLSRVSELVFCVRPSVY